MVVAARTLALVSVSACLALSGCVVSFQDFPLGASGAGGILGLSGSDAGGAISVGSTAGDLAVAGSGAGDTAIGGAMTAGSSAGGAPAAGSSAAGALAGGATSGGTGGAGTGGAEQGGTGGLDMQPSDLLIDDFEDGDSQVSLLDGRNGYWFAANDGTFQSVQTPNSGAAILPSLLAPARAASTRALHTTGSGFANWGAYVAASFVGKGTTAATSTAYDISAHQGLTFYARLGKPTSAQQVRVSVRNFDTLNACTSCGDNFGASVTFSDTFQPISLPFSSFKQQGWGKPLVATFDTKRAYAVVFTWAAHQNFDVWIDDLSFY